MSESIISQKEIQYPKVNIKSLDETVNKIWLLAKQQTSGITAIAEKAERVSSYSRELSELVSESLSKLPPILSQFLAGDIFQSIRKIDKALEAHDLSDEKRSDILKARDQFIQKLSKDIDNVIANFDDRINKLTGKINDINDIVIAGHFEDVLAKTKKQKAELQSDIEQKTKERKKLDAERDKIIESQDVIRAKNIADMFKDYLPNTNDIDGLNFAQPEKEIIKQSIEIVKKVLGKISEGLKYIDLENARMKLTEQIDHTMQESKALKTTLEETELRLSGLKDVMQIDTERTTMLNEVGKLEKAWRLFSSQLHELSDKNINQDYLTNLINGQLNFLDNLVISI
ncbi:alpha-xenorhabdolysin family binary toxin subunit B [Photorhabdus laumondii subsp. laumondii]|uniref:Photorhabdus luminescens subsp. laumondii TTO1 complete genome segment 7/17 n=2 Tax=Photorhabdus laumondii subsp. laumondii TaxID=141679 RepID=Q7N5I7_PHOLL|nr:MULTISPECIES: alpha-xenorhabdolysin family binary toxin subunit B [Photorhabdus]AWK41763.1 XaxB [Photorhabdus laumondii subsp. laumondii]AXG42582.1 XaxB [Photorhabdus laumondii subsp. laumondii]AXG47084.1 XaxB [Photorhabdus laumondii subsp. laumondii]MCC8382501.1 alpha-xenorhabdolysin family binary toxin subunit B [Photorhabdus laumondii]MCC8390843.1 alpha-xenorhabdolysin family binary toxin subunit B [Photorhabdus laumondii]